MSGFLVAAVSRRRLGLLRQLCSVCLTGLALAGCSGSAACRSSSLIGVETSQFSVIIENKVGMPLTEVRSRSCRSAASPSTKMAGRLDNGEEREIALGGFFTSRQHAVQPARGSPEDGPRDREGHEQQAGANRRAVEVAGQL